MSSTVDLNNLVQATRNRLLALIRQQKSSYVEISNVCRNTDHEHRHVINRCLMWRCWAPSLCVELQCFSCCHWVWCVKTNGSSASVEPTISQKRTGLSYRLSIGITLKNIERLWSSCWMQATCMCETAAGGRLIESSDCPPSDTSRTLKTFSCRPYPRMSSSD